MGSHARHDDSIPRGTSGIDAARNSIKMNAPARTVSVHGRIPTVELTAMELANM